MLSISTCWNYSPEMDMHQWLRQVKDIGFDAIELNYQMSRSHLQQVHKTAPQIGLAISSVHNFCPEPNDEFSPRHPSNYYRLSAVDENERRKAVEWTCKTVDTALEFRARAVVNHAGLIDSDDVRAKKLFDLYETKGRDLIEYKEELQKILLFRKRTREPFIKALEQSLSDVMDYAFRKKIKIGLETRYYPTEIPNFQEIGEFLNLFERKGLGYWHDVGHAEMNSRLGIIDHSEYLQAYGQFLIGVHLHGMSGVNDHQAPFVGDFDLNAVLRLLDNSVIRVVETGTSTDEAMRLAVQRLKKS